MSDAGRKCGDCKLCCEVLAVKELEKPVGVLCEHACKGKGCAIYDARPDSCRRFECLWLRGMFHGLKDRPDRLNCVFDVGHSKLEGVPHPVVVHEQFEGASRLGRAAELIRELVEQGRPVIVTFRGRKTLHMPKGVRGLPGTDLLTGS